MSTTESRPATVHDVAREAGVSAQTVSRLVKGFPHISPRTRQRVEDAIELLDYRPNHAARLLRTQKSMRIGAIVHEMFEHGPARLLRGASMRAHDFGYSLSIASVDGEDEDAIARALEGFEAERVAGVLAITLTDSVRNAVERRPIDVPVLIDPAEAQGNGLALNERGGRLVAEHLLSLGHRAFGMVNGPESWLPARQRRDSFLAAVAAGGGRCLWDASGDWSAASGAEAIRGLPTHSGVTAVFAANDSMAMGVLHGLAEAGVSVPQDVSVVGFDDLPESAFTTPELTTFRPDFEEEGRLAVETLLGRTFTDEASPRYPHHELIPRRSSSPLTR